MHLEEYICHPSPQTRNALALTLAQRLKKVCCRHHWTPSSIERSHSLDDAFQTGFLLLLSKIEQFRSSSGAQSRRECCRTEDSVRQTLWVDPLSAELANDFDISVLKPVFGYVKFAQHMEASPCVPLDGPVLEYLEYKLMAQWHCKGENAAEIVQAAIASLSPLHQEIAELYFMDGASLFAIGTAVSKSEEAVSKLLKKIKMDLRRAILYSKCDASPGQRQKRKY